MTINEFALAYCLMGFLGYLLVIADKQAARQNQWRIAERSFVLVALLCGWPGVFMAMTHYRHKVYKTRFKLEMKLAAFCNLAVIGMYLFWPISGYAH